MKTANLFSKLEKAQVLPILVVVFIVLFGFSALIIDGGSVMLNRRTAQVAADAGALAGAQFICIGKSDADVKLEAEKYAVDNGATEVDPITISGKEITVIATVEHPSFFAKIFGEDNLKAKAEAIAGCYYPDSAERVLPIAFYFESPPVNSQDIDCADSPCNLVSKEFHPLMDALENTPTVTGNKINLPLDDIYIISEKTKICEKDVTGVIVCSEMSGLASGGNRAFLDLNQVLKDVIENGLDDPIYLPAWVNGEPGAVTSVYKPSNFITDYDPIVGYEELEARLYFLPVFDKYCADCSCEPTEDFDPVYCDQYNTQSYHLLGFTPFVVTCVQMNSKCEYGECVLAGTYELSGETITVNKAICPGLLASDPLQENVESSLEGYIVEEFPADQYLWGTDGVNVGVNIISLIK